MIRRVAGALASILVTVFIHPQNAEFSKYKAVEAYEVGRGILALPTYSQDGQVCEIGLQRKQYSPERVSFIGLSREDIEAAFDELVPVDVRGPKSDDFADNLILLSGHSITTNVDYKNVSLIIFTQDLPESTQKKIIQEDEV